MIVAGRLAYVNHIPAADAFYHYQCSSSFWTGWDEGGGGGGEIPQKNYYRRPELAVTILTVATFIEETDEQMTVGDLIGKKSKRMYWFVSIVEIPSLDSLRYQKVCDMSPADTYLTKIATNLICRKVSQTKNVPSNTGMEGDS